MNLKYKRILLKLSGEALSGEKRFGIHPPVINEIARDIVKAHEKKVEIGIVIGGGNIFRGVAASTEGMDRASSDDMGMLATVINALALQDALEKLGIDVRVQTAIEMAEVAEPYIRRRALRHLSKRRIVIFGAGTGNPYFTTDTAAALRAMEIQADILLKATRVDGVYDKDPLQFQGAVQFKEVSHIEMLKKGLQVMDSTAVSLCMDNKLPILAFNMNQENGIQRIVQGEQLGTLIHTAATS